MTPRWPQRLMPRLRNVPLSVSAVPPEHVDFVWAQVEPMVRRGLSHGAGDSTTSDHIRAAIKRGELILWAVHEGLDVTAAIVIEVVKHPAKTTLFIVLIAGRRFAEWAPTVTDLLRDYAVVVGADTIESMVRDGLTKWLAPLGWKRKATLVELQT